MNNQLIKKENLSIFNKIRAFFKNIFSKKNKQQMVSTNIQENASKNYDEFAKNLKVNITTNLEKEYEFKNFIKKIEDNPDIIENLSNDRLDILINYYEKITNAKKIKIEKLKASVN